MFLLYCMLGVIIPFVGTCLGSFFVFFLKKDINPKFHKIMIGFAIGVMLAASIWSLIIPSIEIVESNYKVVWIPAVFGLLFGVLFLIFVNRYLDRFCYKKNSNMNMLMLSVTIHNIPEGMAVGVCFSSVLSGNVGVSLLSAFLLAIGIAIQNIPEGAIISMPLQLDGKTKKKAFLTGVVSGVVEPISSLITIIMINYIVPVLPYLLSFAAGAMIYVVIEELVQEMHEDGNSPLGIISVIIGFCVMLVLDITLG